MIRLNRRIAVKLAPGISVEGLTETMKYPVIGTSTMVKERDGKFNDWDMYVLAGDKGKIVQVFPSKVVIAEVD